MKTKIKNRKEVVKAIRLIWSSLDSHLDYTTQPSTKMEKKVGESRKFHLSACKEYLQVLKVLLSQL